MKKNDSLYVKLKAGVMGFFRSVYVYIDSDNANSIHLFRERGLKFRIKEGMKPVDNPESLNLLFVYVPKSKADVFEECMEIHKRNSIILGWGCTEQCQKMIEDMHKCATENA